MRNNRSSEVRRARHNAEDARISRSSRLLVWDGRRTCMTIGLYAVAWNSGSGVIGFLRVPPDYSSILSMMSWSLKFACFLHLNKVKQTLSSERSTIGSLLDPFVEERALPVAILDFKAIRVMLIFLNEFLTKITRSKYSNQTVLETVKLSQAHLHVTS